MSDDPARIAAVNAALELVEPDTTIGLGSGRAVFALAAAIGRKFPDGGGIRVVAGSTETAKRASDAGLEVVNLLDVDELDRVFDGADEVDPQLRLIKGLGAALIREKLLMETSRHNVVFVQDSKLVSYLGEKNRVPVEVVAFAWKTTLKQLEEFSEDCVLRTVGEMPVITDENNYIIDVGISQGTDLDAFANNLKLLPGVVGHGLFLDHADEVIIGFDDGTAKTLQRH